MLVLFLLAVGCFYAAGNGGLLAAHIFFRVLAAHIDSIVSSYCCLCCLCICANAAAIL